MCILSKDMILLEHFYVLTNFVVLVLDSHLNLSFKKINHVVGISHLRHLLLFIFCDVFVVIALIKTVVKHHAFVSRFLVIVSEILVRDSKLLFFVNRLKKFIFANTKLSSRERSKLFVIYC